MFNLKENKMNILKTILNYLKSLFCKKVKENIEVVECSRSYFKEVLDELYGDDYYDFDAYCDDLRSKLAVTGSITYEISRPQDQHPTCFECELKTIEWVGTLEDLENGQYPTFRWID
jgi:hypothetical protein